VYVSAQWEKDKIVLDCEAVALSDDEVDAYGQNQTSTSRVAYISPIEDGRGKEEEEKDDDSKLR
jgi:hypothetical protein